MIAAAPPQPSRLAAPRPSALAEWRSSWPLLPALLAVLAYLPSLAGTYVYDDDMIISKNDFVKDPRALSWLLSPKHYYGQVPESKEGSKEQSYRPLGTLTHVLECRVFWPAAVPEGDADPPAPTATANGAGEPGATAAAGAPPPAAPPPAEHDVPGGFRLTSVYLHALNALLLTALARRLFGLTRVASVAAGALFALHPLATEAVVVASFREDPLCLFFLLAGLLFYVGRGHAPGPAGVIWSWQGAVCFFLAMLSKEVGLVAIPLAVGADWVFGPRLRERNPLRQALRIGPLAVATGAFVWIRFVWAYNAGEGTTPWPGGDGGSRFTSLCTMLPVFAHYARLFVCPDVLRADYMVPVRWGMFEPEVVGAACALVAVVALAVAAARASRVAGFGLVFAALTLAPVANLIPIRNVCAERYLYVPLAGVALAGGVAAAWAWRRALAAGWARAALPVGALLAMGLAARTTWRVLEWDSNDTIWVATVRDEPLSTRGNISAAAFYNVRGSRHLIEAERLDQTGDAAGAERARARMRADWAKARVHAGQVNRTPWKMADPRRPSDPGAPLVEVYSDAQVERRRFEAWRLMAEIDWIYYDKAKDTDPDGALATLRRARLAIDACRAIVDELVRRGEAILERDQAIFEVSGRIHEALPESRWRAFWAARDRSHAARHEKRFDDAIAHDRRALGLTTDAAYLALQQPHNRREMEAQRWRVLADLGSALEERSQFDEARQVFTLAVREAQALRAAGRWPIADATAWVALAGAANNRRPRESREPDPLLVRGEGADGALPKAHAFVLPPDRGTGLTEARRLAALGQFRAAGLLADWALGPDAPGPVADADATAAWSAPVDRVWIALAGGGSPDGAALAAASAALEAEVARGATPGVTAWERTMQRFDARAAAPDPVADQLAVALLLRARFLATDPLYGSVTRGRPGSERARLQADRWNLEHDLCWWYREVLGLSPRAAEHGRAAMEAWDKLVAAGQAGAMTTDPATFRKLSYCAALAGADAARARYDRERARLEGGG